MLWIHISFSSKGASKAARMNIFIVHHCNSVFLRGIRSVRQLYSALHCNDMSLIKSRWDSRHQIVCFDWIKYAVWFFNMSGLKWMIPFFTFQPSSDLLLRIFGRSLTHLVAFRFSGDYLSVCFVVLKSLDFVDSDQVGARQSHVFDGLWANYR